MIRSDFSQRLLAAVAMFMAADSEAIGKVSPGAFDNLGVLAGMCAKTAGLPTDERYWDMSGRCPVVHAVMVMAYFKTDHRSVGVVEAAWRAVQAPVSKKPRPNPLLPTPAEYLQMLSVLVAAEAGKRPFQCPPMPAPEVFAEALG